VFKKVNAISVSYLHDKACLISATVEVFGFSTVAFLVE